MRIVKTKKYAQQMESQEYPADLDPNQRSTTEYLLFAESVLEMDTEVVSEDLEIESDIQNNWNSSTEQYYSTEAEGSGSISGTIVVKGYNNNMYLLPLNDYQLGLEIQKVINQTPEFIYDDEEISSILQDMAQNAGGRIDNKSLTVSTVQVDNVVKSNDPNYKYANVSVTIVIEAEATYGNF